MKKAELSFWSLFLAAVLFKGSDKVDAVKLLVPDADGNAVGANSSCPRECFCSLASMTLQHLVVQPSQKAGLAQLCSSDTALLAMLSTLGRDNFGIVGKVEAHCSFIEFNSATLSGTVTSDTSALSVAADGTTAVTHMVQQAPFELTVAGAGLHAGDTASFLLQASTTAEARDSAASFNVVSSEQAATAVSYPYAASDETVQANSVSSSSGTLSVSVSACDGENVRMTQIEYGKTSNTTIDGIIAKSGDHAFGGCYDLTAADRTITAKNLTLGDSVIAFFETVGGKNYLRAAYVISAVQTQ